jgi:L-lactate permease
MILISLSVVVALVVLIRSMHRMRLRAQFLVLLGLGVAIGFTFLAMVQLPQFPSWLGVLLMVVVLTSSPFAIRIFVRSLMQEEEQANEMHGGTK